MFLKQNAATTIVIGAMVDEDGKTLETGLSLAASDVKIIKSNGAFASKSSTAAPVHIGNGFYSVALNATDTNTPGYLIVNVKVAGVLVSWLSFTVYPPHIYDSMIAGSQVAGTGIPCDVRAINGTRSDNGTASLNIRQLQIQGDGSGVGLFVGGVNIEANNATTPALQIQANHGSPAALIVNSGAGSGLAVQSSGGVGADIRSTAAGQVGLFVSGGAAAAAIYAKGGDSTAGANGGAGLALRGGAGSTATGRTGGDGIFAEGSIENGGDGIRAKSNTNPGVGVNIIGDDGTALVIKGFSKGIEIDGGVSSDSVGVSVRGNDYGLHCSVDEDGFAAAYWGSDLGSSVSYGSGVDAIAINANGNGVYIATAGTGETGSSAIYAKSSGKNPAVKIEGTNGAAIRAKTLVAPIEGAGNTHAIEILAPDHGGVLIESDSEAITFKSLSNAAIRAISSVDSAVVIESLDGSNSPAVRVTGNTGAAIFGRWDGLTSLSFCTENNAAYLSGGFATYGASVMQGKPGGPALQMVKGTGAAWDVVADNISPRIAELYSKLPTAGLIAGQNDVLAIRNNTTFTTTIPDSGTIPAAGVRPVRIRCYIYDTEGNMETPDNGLAMTISSAQGASMNGKLFQDVALTIPAADHPGYPDLKRVEPLAGVAGVFDLYYKLESTDTATILSSDFIYTEGGKDIVHGRQTNLYSETPGLTTLADTATNREVIAKSIRNHIPTAELTGGSVQGEIQTAIGGVKTVVDSTALVVGDVKTVVDNISIDVDNLDAWLRTQFADLSKVADITAAVNTIVTNSNNNTTNINANIDAEALAILAAIQANAVEVAKIVAKLPVAGLISSLQITSTTAEGVSLEEAIDTIRAGLRGRFKKEGNALTFYRSDASTECFKVSVTASERYPLS